MARNNSGYMSHPGQERKAEWDEIAGEIIDEDRELLDALAD